MTINGIDIAEYGAVQLTVDMTAPAEGCPAEWPENAMVPRSWIVTQKFGKLNVTLLFRGTEHDEIIRAAGALIMPLCRRAVLTLDGYDGEFIVFYNGGGAPEKVKGTKTRYTMSIDCKYYRRDPERVMTAVGGASIVLFGAGTRPAPAVLELTATADIAGLTVAGLPGGDITVSELYAGETLIIDGEAGTATVDGANAFARVWLWQFPAVLPGENHTLTFTADEAGKTLPLTATLRYHPMLLM